VFTTKTPNTHKRCKL